MTVARRSGPDGLETTVDAELQHDIESHLRKITREGHDDECGFEVVSARPYGADELSIVGRTTPEQERRERKLKTEGKVHVEKWTIDSWEPRGLRSTSDHVSRRWHRHQCNTIELTDSAVNGPLATIRVEA